MPFKAGGFKRKPAARSRKRFNAKWKLGLGVRTPFGSGNISFDSKVAKAVKNIEIRNAEPKHKIVTNLTQTMLHGTLYTYNILGNITQGTDYSNRIGDTIDLEHFRYKSHFYRTSTASNAVWIRYWIIKHDTEVGTASDAYGTGINYSDIQLVASPSAPCQILDPKKCYVVQEDMFQLPTQDVASKVTSVCKDINLNFNHKRFTYKSSSNYASKGNYYLIVTSHVEGGTSGVTGTCTVEGTVNTIFKDL